MADATTVYHPTIPDISHEVEDVDAWVKQGWLKAEPKNVAVSEQRRATERARRADAKAFGSADAVTPGVSDIPEIDPAVHSAPEPPGE